MRFLFLCLCAALFGIAGVTAGAAEGPRVVFDEAHGQPFRISEEGPLHLSAFADLLRSEGCRVTSTLDPLNDRTLAGADVLVSSGPFRPFSPGEIAALERFLDRGGRFALLIHVPHPAAPLLARLGVAHSNAPIRERDGTLEGDERNFAVTRFQGHPLTQGMERFALFGSWALNPLLPEVVPVALTGPRAWIDLDGDGRFSSGDAEQGFAVAVGGTRGSGAFVVFGDDTAFQNRFLGEHNAELGHRLARWAKRGG